MSISHKVLVDVDTSKEVNEEFHFEDPAGNIVQQKVDYDMMEDKKWDKK